MNNVVVALLFGIGSGGWVYARVYRKTGGNRQNSIIAAVAVGLVLLIILLMILNAIFPPD